MKLYEIVWCFIDEDGEVVRDEWEDEKYYIAYIKATCEESALSIWNKRQHFKRNPEIVEINVYVEELKNGI